MTIDEAYRLRDFLVQQIASSQISLKAIDEQIARFIMEQNKPKVVQDDSSRQG